jgi:hypothetical protein
VGELAQLIDGALGIAGGPRDRDAHVVGGCADQLSEAPRQLVQVALDAVAQVPLDAAAGGVASGRRSLAAAQDVLTTVKDREKARSAARAWKGNPGGQQGFFESLRLPADRSSRQVRLGRQWLQAVKRRDCPDRGRRIQR